MQYQNTIARPVETEGIGLHTAVRGHLRLVPAPAGTGIVFRRVDLDNFEIEAHGRWLARVSYATSLMKKGVLLSTVEHVLAALYASGIDNVYIELDALEVPILDGSSRPFVQMIAEAGIRRLRRRRRCLRLVRPVEISDGERQIAAYPADNFRVRYFIDFPHPLVGREEIELDVDAESFSRVLAPARTFGFLEDVSRLRSMDLIRGGSLDNAIVLTRDGLMNGELRFPDEFARHKALDLIGDLALVGRPLKAYIVAHKAGHAMHTALVTRLLSDRSLWVETADPSAPERQPLGAPLSAVSTS
ncbi:MAG TPA: UDP-3-O-acyl-N-acetylglucosamine deacetylase [Candidatus Dormibacteraeota bacterium]|nr:UDP-3-O-acyl-N-acetylglucosamine deacetylase [Candidatus Dormibacteraeota bacterium]